MCEGEVCGRSSAGERGSVWEEDVCGKRMSVGRGSV